MNEIYNILKGFFKDNKSLVVYSVGFQVLYSILETILIPLVLAGAFNNITSLPKLKKHLISTMNGFQSTQLTKNTWIFFQKKKLKRN